MKKTKASAVKQQRKEAEPAMLSHSRAVRWSSFCIHLQQSPDPVDSHTKCTTCLTFIQFAAGLPRYRINIARS